MVALGVFQALLNGIGSILAWIYQVVGNFGVSIIILTLLIRIVLLPLGIKQIKSMGAMQAIQPKIKEIQKKYKGNKQKAQEETMKLYKEAGVNPLGGCLPLLLQFPILIAMYAVIRPPQLLPATVDGQDVYEVHNNHLPVDSQLFENVVLHQDLNFLGLNLQCSASQSGTQATEKASDRKPVTPNTPILNSDGTPLSFDATTGDGKIDCGSKPIAKIPYFVLLVVMVGTTFYQQRQMQRASPPGAASGQQQAILKFMPLMFGIFGFTFPAGLTLYWTVSNLWQIGQQWVLLKAGHIGPEAMERRMAEQRAKNANGPPAKKGLMARMQERAEDARRQQDGKRPTSGSGGKSTGGGGSKGQQPKQRRPNTGGSKGGGGRPTPKRRPGGGDSGGKGDGEAGT
jgi:YidC/Oxa1 family membrane protein insertase